MISQLVLQEDLSKEPEHIEVVDNLISLSLHFLIKGEILIVTT